MTYVNPWADGIKPNGEDINNIKTEVEGIQTDLSNETDGLGVLKTSIENIASGFTEYSYANALASNATFTPPAKTILMSIWGHIPNKIAIRAYTAGMFLDSVSDHAANSQGILGCVYCDGTQITIRNTSGIDSINIILLGVTLG